MSCVQTQLAVAAILGHSRHYQKYLEKALSKICYLIDFF